MRWSAASFAVVTIIAGVVAAGLGVLLRRKWPRSDSRRTGPDWSLTAHAGVAVAVRRGVTAPCACFGSGSRAPLGGVHLARNAYLLAVLVTGVASAGLQRWQPGLASAGLAASAGGVSALLLTRLDDVAALFRAAR